MDETYHLLECKVHRFGESYQLELGHTDPSSQAQLAPARGGSLLAPGELLSLEPSPADYGRALAEQLFYDPTIKQRFVQAETAAQASRSGLRLRLSIDPSAQELQALRWELLRHPDSGALLSSSPTLLLSRFILSRDWRPVKLRARSQLRALIAVSAPPAAALAKLGLAPVDFEAEVAGVREALTEVQVSTLGGAEDPMTAERLLEELERGVDILYLVSHGMFGRATRLPALILQGPDGQPKPARGDELAERVAELHRPPRLIVLASCQSAGDGEQLRSEQGATAQATLAGRLADAGVPALIAMQGFISMATVSAMMPVFFRELARDGHIERALAVARSEVRGQPDAWMPALFTRLSAGRLWYTPGFKGEAGQEVWRRLLKPVRDGKVVPILGPRLLEDAYGDAHQTAERLAGSNNFPYATHDWEDLPRVTEFMSVVESRYNVIQAYQDQLLSNLIEQHRSWLPPAELPPATKRPKLGRLLALVSDHLRAHNPVEPYQILAELPASVYVTTNYTPMLLRALKVNERRPQQLLTRWRHQKVPRSADEDRFEDPSPKSPLVYHVFGAFGAKEDNLVLTEDDHFDYLIATTAAQLIPPAVESALVDNSLLFLGFRLTDWHFRVLFRLMMSLPGRERLKQYCHVAVQLDPDMQSMSDVEGAKNYLTAYFGQEANIDIFWGSSGEFLAALHEELAAAGELERDPDEGEEDDDEWTF